MPSIEAPLWIYEASDRPSREGDYLAVIATFIYAGADLLDDLQDEDSFDRWKGFSKADLSLVATTFLSALPWKILSEMKIPLRRRLLLQKTLASKLLRMSEGQERDLNLPRRGESSDEAICRSVEAKSGEEMGLFTLLPAQMACFSKSRQRLCDHLGQMIGTASQLASDFNDLSSIKNKRYTAFLVEFYCQRAMQVLRQLRFPSQVTQKFNRRIESISLFNKASSPTTQGGFHARQHRTKDRQGVGKR
ncbi:MAG: hypothetical protein Q7S98_06760 [Deltaproteobacteria bacterium]|nr:hypothetical protein [Deltaproteobacteria bacterium]